MTFLQKFFSEVFQHQSQGASTRLRENDRVQRHLEVSRYGQFELTDAIRPSLDLTIEPRQGYRHETYVDDNGGGEVPVIMAAASKEILFPLFMELVGHLGDEVDVVLETSHDHAVSGHLDLYRENIDMPVLSSIMWEYEDLLTNDGCTGVAVLNPAVPQEIQFDEHKLLIMYGSPLEPFERILEKYGVSNEPDIQFITEAEHVHSSTASLQEQFEELRLRLGTCLDNEDDFPEEDRFEGSC